MPAALSATRSLVLFGCRHLLDQLYVDPRGLRQSGAVLSVRLVEVADHDLFDFRALHLVEVARQILDQMVLLLLGERAIERARLAKVLFLLDHRLLGHGGPMVLRHLGAAWSF